VFVVGEAEPWISPTDLSTGCALWKQGVAATLKDRSWRFSSVLQTEQERALWVEAVQKLGEIL
jgi:hypothetical protein